MPARWSPRNEPATAGVAPCPARTRVVPGAAAVVVRRAALDEILPLRHAELRAGLPRDAARFDGDDEPSTIHVGAFLSAGEVVGCATFVRRPLDAEPGWQLRGMATRADRVRRGVGARVLAVAEALVPHDAGGTLLWCNARVPAVAFYRAQGWEPISAEFDIPTAGPHRRMRKRRDAPPGAVC